MNYLAHAYLSFHEPEILVGNMISDFVKGRAKYDYPAGVQRGITLHRAIDEFTDFHVTTSVAKEFFRSEYRLYAGPFVDIVYDHFLALDRDQFASSEHLYEFSRKTYATLEKASNLLPLGFGRMLPFMSAQNWLYNYRYEEGIRNSFQGLVRRAKYLSESAVAYQIFLKHYDDLKLCFHEFFPSLKAYVLNELQHKN